MVVLERITSIFFIYNHVKVCSALHLEQQLFHAIKNMHFTTYASLFRYIMLEVIILKEFNEFCDTTQARVQGGGLPPP